MKDHVNVPLLMDRYFCPSESRRRGCISISSGARNASCGAGSLHNELRCKFFRRAVHGRQVAHNADANAVFPQRGCKLDRKGELPPRVDSPTAAEPTLASSEDMPTSSVIAPVVSASRRPDSPATTEMEIAPAGSSDALATARANESSEDKSNPRVRPSSLSVCLRPTTCNVQSFTGRKEPCKYGGGPVCCLDVRYCRQPSAELNTHDWILKDGATAQSPFLQSR